jgi:hypothetical protein
MTNTKNNNDKHNDKTMDEKFWWSIFVHLLMKISNIDINDK